MPREKPAEADQARVVRLRSVGQNQLACAGMNAVTSDEQVAFRLCSVFETADTPVPDILRSANFLLNSTGMPSRCAASRGTPCNNPPFDRVPLWLAGGIFNLAQPFAVTTAKAHGAQFDPFFADKIIHAQLAQDAHAVARHVKEQAGVIVMIRLRFKIREPYPARFRKIATAGPAMPQPITNALLFAAMLFAVMFFVVMSFSSFWIYAKIS